MDAEGLLRLKIRLLTEGATIPDEELSVRRGGAGPVGARYFLLPNDRPCGVPIRSGEYAERFQSASLRPTDDPAIWMYDNHIKLREVPQPEFYKLETEDGTSFKKLALLHGTCTLATTVYQSCRYWDSNTQCQFCTIPTSLLSGETVLEKRPEQLAEIVREVEQYGLVKDILLTTGTPDLPDVGCERLIKVTEKIRQVSELPIGVQFEPPMEQSILRRLRDAGVTTVGIHLESPSEEIRREFCPGKYEYASIEEYTQAWKEAVGVFGRGNVSTFLLQGLGESKEDLLRIAVVASEMGVVPIVAPIRPAKGSRLANYTPTYVGDLKGSFDLYRNLGQILHKNALNPKSIPAGCQKCGGCTPIQEAYDLALYESL